MTTYRAARAYLRANLALRSAIQAGDAQAVVNALEGTYTAMQAFDAVSDQRDRLHYLWDRYHSTAVDSTLHVAFCTTGEESEELAATALYYMFSEPGAYWLDVQVKAISNAAEDDIIVVGYHDKPDGEVPDALVNVVTDLAVWCREQAKGVIDAGSDSD